jgi:hypothetical protein
MRMGKWEALNEERLMLDNNSAIIAMPAVSAILIAFS